MTQDLEDNLAFINHPLEQEVLSALLGQPGLLHQMPFLQERHFADETHKFLFSTIERRLTGNMPVSPAAIAEELPNREYLVGLLRHSTYVVFPVESAKRLVELGNIRDLIASCNTMAEQARAEPSVTFAELSAGMMQAFDRINAAEQMRKFRTAEQVTAEILEDYKLDRKPTSTGLKRLDLAMGGGLFAGRSYGFAARKKVGKTALCATLSYNLAQQGVKHLFVACEMGAKEIHQRNLARQMDISPSTLRDYNSMSAAQRQKLSSAAVNQSKCMIYQDAPGLTFGDLRRYVAGAVNAYKIQGFILDYWQLVGGKPKNKSTAEHLDEIAQWIADFCRKHGLWSITMAQINQDGNTRGSEGIRLAFDQVYQLRGMGEKEDITYPNRWVQMLDTRYTAWVDIGDPARPGLLMEPNGPYFSEA